MAVNPTVHLIAILSDLIRRKIDSAEDVGGLTPAQNGIPHFILGRYRKQDLFRKDIEEEFNPCRPTTTEILKLMERKSLIYREEASYDARRKKIIPTERGWELEGRMLKDILEMEQFITQDIPREELGTFIRIGMKMTENLK